MKVTLDISAGVNVPAGLGRYARALTEALLDQGLEPSLFYNQIQRRSQPIPTLAHLPAYQVRLGYKPWRMACYLGQISRLPFNRLIDPETEIFHATEHLLLPLRGIKTVLTVHDLIYKLFPEHHKRLNYWFLNAAMPLFVRRADAIIAISEATKRDLISHYKTPAEKIHVIYEAAAPHFRPQSPERIAEVRKRYKLPSCFVLVVGTIEPRKNYGRLITALHDLRRDMPDLHLVVVGSKGWLYEPLFAQIEELGAGDWVIFPGFIPDADLPAVYAASTLTVMASIYEGFGLPILEALACGAGVASSSAASLPELGGDAVAYFDPLNTDDIRETLRGLLSDSNRLAALRAAAPAQAAQFSWERAARETLALYEQLRGK